MTGHRDGVHRDPIDPLPGRGDRRERTARAAVLEHATGEHRRHFPTLIHVGAPLGRATVVPADHGGDHALRTDVLGALLWRRRHEAPLVWLTARREVMGDLVNHRVTTTAAVVVAAVVVGLNAFLIWEAFVA